MRGLQLGSVAWAVRAWRGTFLWLPSSPVRLGPAGSLSWVGVAVSHPGSWRGGLFESLQLSCAGGVFCQAVSGGVINCPVGCPVRAWLSPCSRETCYLCPRVLRGRQLPSVLPSSLFTCLLPGPGDWPSHVVSLPTTTLASGSPTWPGPTRAGHKPRIPLPSARVLFSCPPPNPGSCLSACGQSSPSGRRPEWELQPPLAS